MNTKNYLIPTQRYKRLLSCTHSLFRLLNSTFNLRDLILRLARLICQTLGVGYCAVILLDPSKKFASLRCVVRRGKKSLIEEKTKIKNGVEKRVVHTSSVILQKSLLTVPLIAEDIIGIIVVHQNKKATGFNIWDQEILMTIAQQAIIGIRNIQLYEEQQRIILGSIKSLVTMLDVRIPREYAHSPHFAQMVSAIGEQINCYHDDNKQNHNYRQNSIQDFK